LCDTSYLPRPLSPKDDQLLQQYLRAQDNLSSNALLLLRYTGMRIGEFMRLPTDSLRHIGGDQWALHVPLGKLRTERWVPADAQIRQLHARLLLLREETALASRCNLLLPYRGHDAACQALRKELRNAAQQAGCPRGVTPHRLRHTFATEMLRAGTSLPALMHLLGHNHLNMTLRYVQVTQDDLQHEYHNARKSMLAIHAIPELHRTPSSNEPAADLNGILKSMTAMHHLVEMFRRALTDEQSRRKTARLTKRLVNITTEFRKFIPTQK
jgi:site-specific recombinase XerD